ncbi:MAG: hypothetical protein K2Q06_13580 [Parvularculaceae bacterium]|nr:hypothetical protein [Parvularculaceae bacterium]
MSRMITDEQLSAFMDGELGADEAAAVRRAVDADAGLAARLERLRAADLSFQRTVRVAGDAPLSPGLAAFVGGGAESAPQHRRWLAPFAMAASLAVGAVGGAQLESGRGAEAFGVGRLAESSPIARALASTPGGADARIAGATLTPITTFRTESGGLCREFRLERGGDAMRSVACRSAGGWTTEVTMRDASSHHGYRPAASNTGPIDDFVDSRIVGDPLVGEDERAALAPRR